MAIIRFFGRCVLGLIRFLGICLVRLFLAVCGFLCWLLIVVAVASLLFAFAVRGFTTIAPPKPSLNSFDPQLRAAAAEAAGLEYGDKP